MRKPKAKSDRRGYIYALVLKGKYSPVLRLCPGTTPLLSDHMHPGRIRVKVGRSNDVARRLSEHRRRCPSSRPILLGYTGLVPSCDKLERLIHIELADRAAQSIPADRTAPRTKCRDCE